MFIQQANLYYGGAECQSPVEQAVAAWYAGGYAAYDFTALTYALAKADLTGNLRHCTDGAAFPAHTPGVGCTFNGTDQYLISGITGATRDWTFIIKFLGSNDGSVRALFGYSTEAFGPPRIGALVSTTTLFILRIFGASASVTVSDSTRTTLACNRTNVYHNGTSIAAISPTQTDSTGSIYIGAANQADVPTQFYKGIASSFYAQNSSLPDENIATISAAMP